METKNDTTHSEHPSKSKKSSGSSDDTTVVTRIRNELLQIHINPHEWISIGCVGSEPLSWQGSMLGPTSTPYESGMFFITIRFVKEYPAVPPEINITTKIYHPNVHLDNGRIDFIDLTKGQSWESLCGVGSSSRKIQMIDVIHMIYDLWLSPYVHENAVTCNEEMAHLYLHNRSKYNEYVKEWTKEYAM
jgi:ubiquitin-protein ligase